MSRIYGIINWLFQPLGDQRLTSAFFIRLLALIYAIAFISMAVQIEGLAGPSGILPFNDHLRYTREEMGPWAYLWLPVIYWWLEPTGWVLRATAWVGAVFSLLVLWGRWQRTLLVLMFVLYLSLYHAGQYFTNFQWDALLLESGFLAILLASGPTRLAILLLEWLLFRLRFMSGYFKLASGDPSWTDWTALNHYFETQPLPHIGAWYAHQLPDWMLKGGVGLTYFSELVVPFFIFLPRHFRWFAAGVTLLMQVLTIATSNHNFINLLTIALCLFLLGDAPLRRLMPARWLDFSKDTIRQRGILLKSATMVALILIFPASLIAFGSNAMHQPMAEPMQTYTQAVRRLGLGNIYHVFPTMQTERQELEIQGSLDGIDWQTYRFSFKPDEPKKPPVFNLPHQPRLDWMMWFVPTQHEAQMVWFGEFLHRLHQNEVSVTSLLAVNPFEQKPPRYLRVLAYSYRFTTPKERASTGDWWRRELLGQFPMVNPRRP